MGFLFTFFLLPLFNLAQTSTQTPVGGGDTGQYEQTFRFQNYIDAFVENREQFGQPIGKYNFYTSSDKIMKCDVADYKQEALIIGTGGNSCIHLAKHKEPHQLGLFVFEVG